MAEDAWQALPYAAPTTSVFQAGWVSVPDTWRTGVSPSDLGTWKAVLGIRSEVNQLLEKSRAAKALGASLEAKVLLYVSDPTVRSALQALQASTNGQDALRYAFITSHVELVDSAATATAAAFSSSSEEVEGVSGLVTVGVSKADGKKCARCWNYSAAVGEDAEHPELCERCAPVVKASGFVLPTKEVEREASTVL